MRFTVRRMMVTVAILGVATWLFARSANLRRSYAAGWWEAQCELWRGEATIYALGGFRMGDLCNLDRSTGLPIAFVTGCVVREGDSERVKGHNDRIRRYIREHGLPKNTLKPWEKDLFDLKHFFDTGSLTDRPKRLIANAPPFSAPDGRNSVRLVADVRSEGGPDDSLRLVLAAGSAVLDDWYVHSGDGRCDLLWGPEGSRFVLIRSVLKEAEHYAAYDLRTGGFLREESWRNGKHLNQGQPIDIPLDRSPHG